MWYGCDFESLGRLLGDHGPDIAAVILDPVQLREPIEAGLARLREMVDAIRTLLILDECKTGLRVAEGGVQELYKVRADITVLSKAIANGFPLAVVIGARDILSKRTSTRIMGTYNGELASIAAALETIAQIKKNDVTRRIDEMGLRLLEGINDVLRGLGLTGVAECVPYRWPCMPYIHFVSSAAARSLKAEFYSKLVQCGVLMAANHPNFVSYAHDEAHIGMAVERIRVAFKAIT